MFKNQSLLSIFMLKKIVFTVFLASIFSNLFATDNYYYVQLKNKLNNPYSIHSPKDFLSEKALSRRSRFGIAIDSTDLPVNPEYLSQISSMGVKIHSSSRWMNGITIISNNTEQIDSIKKLNFIEFIQYTGKGDEINVLKSSKFELSNPTINKVIHSSSNNNYESITYGTSETQIKQINANALHESGYWGDGIEVTVLDAGFKNVDINIGFDSLRQNGRLVSTFNVVNPDSSVFSAHEHGANVLSIMTGNLPGQFLGIAPKASYRIVLSEHSPTEYLREVDFWVRAIEYADSAGSDIINSSLGYAYFDDPALDFTYQDMNGEVSRASRAAYMASTKGIIVCVSAGNEGLKEWKYIGSPADAKNILAVGAVTSTDISSTFSSYGPSSDGRTKPDLSAMGTSTAYINYNGITSIGNGTSYSSPVIAGAMTCLLEYVHKNNKRVSIEELLNIVRTNSSLYSTPDLQMGFGIPDFGKIMEVIDQRNDLTATRGPDSQFFTFETGYIHLRSEYISDQNNSMSIYDIQGRKLISTTGSTIDIQRLVPGIYILKISNLNLNAKFIIK